MRQACLVNDGNGVVLSPNRSVVASVDAHGSALCKGSIGQTQQQKLYDGLVKFLVGFSNFFFDFIPDRYSKIGSPQALDGAQSGG